MGARESKVRGEADDSPGPPDYYALLEVDETATADEIKVSAGNTLHRLFCNSPW